MPSVRWFDGSKLAGQYSRRGGISAGGGRVEMRDATAKGCTIDGRRGHGRQQAQRASTARRDEQQR